MFVYGTLKRGFFNHYVLTGHSSAEADETVRTPAHFYGAARTLDCFKLVVGGRYQVPFLLDAPCEDQVSGEGNNAAELLI